MSFEAASVHKELYSAHSEAYGPRVRELVRSGLEVSLHDYRRALAARDAYRKEMCQLFEFADVVVSPGAPGPAPRGLETTGSPRFQIPWTLADFPTVSLPLALGHDGLPLGIQVTGPPLDEGALLETSRRIEETIGFDAVPAPFPVPGTR
jgi:Asp-tRNA(Asn)/Glu-tRNA(Gln) amidotransferase A subunit family amidase